MWSLVSLSLQSAFSEENGHCCFVHNTALSWTLLFKPSSPWSVLFCSLQLLPNFPSHPLLLLGPQPALLTPPLCTLSLSAFLPKPCSLSHSAGGLPRTAHKSAGGLPRTAYRALSMSSGTSTPASPIGYPLPSLHSDFFSLAFSSFHLKRNLPRFCIAVHYHPSGFSFTAQSLGGLPTHSSSFPSQ